MPTPHPIKTCEEIIDTMVRDFTTVAPRSKSEVRKRILEAMRTAADACRPKEYNHAVGENKRNPYHGKDEVYCCIECYEDEMKNAALQDMDSLKSSFFGEK